MCRHAFVNDVQLTLRVCCVLFAVALNSLKRSVFGEEEKRKSAAESMTSCTCGFSQSGGRWEMGWKVGSPVFLFYIPYRGIDRLLSSDCESFAKNFES